MNEFGPAIGAQEQEHGYALRGVSFDRKAPEIEIMVGDLEGTEHHLTHALRHVRRVDLWTGIDGRDAALRFERADGVTLLRFQDRPSTSSEKP